MKSLTKVFLALGCGLGLLVLAGAGFAWWYWHRYGDDLIEGAKKAPEQGRQEGATMDEAACLEAAVERHRQDPDPGMSTALPRVLRLMGCLETSRVSPDFCRDVPPPTAILKLPTWSAARCAKLRLQDPYCPQIFQHVAEYCASPDRQEKLSSLPEEAEPPEPPPAKRPRPVR